MMGPNLGHLIIELNPLIAIIPGMLAAYYTYLLTKRKSRRDELFQEMNYWKNTAEEERKRRIKAENEADEARQALRTERAKNQKENEND